MGVERQQIIQAWEGRVVTVMTVMTVTARLTGVTTRRRRLMPVSMRVMVKVTVMVKLMVMVMVRWTLIWAV
jgi:hypothetical protein